MARCHDEKTRSSLRLLKGCLSRGRPRQIWKKGIQNILAGKRMGWNERTNPNQRPGKVESYLQHLYTNRHKKIKQSSQWNTVCK
jgi:hypothetical protein